MDTNLHVNNQSNEENPPRTVLTREDSLHIILTRPTEGVQSCSHHHGESACGSREETQLCTAEDAKETESRGGSAHEVQEEKAYKQKFLEMLRELRVFHSDKLMTWREAVRECAFMLKKAPQRSDKRQHSSSTDITVCKTWACSSSLCDAFLSIGEDIENIIDKVSKIMTKLDAAVLQLSTDKASAVATALHQSRDTLVQPEDVRNRQLEPDLEAEDGGNQSLAEPSPNTAETHESGFSISSSKKMEDTGEQLQVGPQVNDVLGKPTQSMNDVQEVTEEDKKKIDDKKEEKERSEWITIGHTGQPESGHSDVPDQCFIRTPAGAAKGLKCELADTLSCLIVTGSEELLSRVIRIKVEDGASLQFPVTVGVPFQVQHRSSSRDVAVKIVNDDRRVSYITPLTTDGVYRGQKGSFAEVKVYSLGLFAVVSCLKRENYIIPKRGLSLKLPMDPRICLNYLPGSFTAPVMAQTMIQPVEAVLLAAVKSRNDLYKSVVSASPLLCLTHPASQPLRRPLTVTLPCPPNPEKRRNTRAQVNQDQQCRPVSVSLLPSDRRRVPGASVKTKETPNESLIVLGSRDEQWSVVNKVSVRNQQNGLVSFDLLENFDRLLVVRLLSPLQPCHLVSLAEELEEAVCCHAVTVILQRQHDDPHTVLVAALPSRDLSWELSKLRAQGFSGLVETSSEICMHEADQLFLHFSGNISSTAFAQNNKQERLTFHSQRRNHLSVRLTEVDPFGNYSSPHYKGTLLLYKVTRGQLEWQGDEAVLKDTELLGDPICKLSLALPKKVRRIHRPITARVKLCDKTESLSDDLLFWLSEELSQKETALLVSSLCLRRSAAQMVKLRAGDSPSAQTFHVLAMWRRALPAIQHQPKASQLAQCLAQSGRPDLARELLLRQAKLTEMRRLKK